MRDRLVELVQNALFQHAHYVAKERQRALEAETEAEHSEIYESIKTLHEYVADYLLANGVIVPPCKVGDKVFIIEKEYRLNKVEHKIVTCEIEYIYISSKTKRYHTKKLECPYMDNGFNFRPKDIGKTVFLTKEQAEAKLKERENNA